MFESVAKNATLEASLALEAISLVENIKRIEESQKKAILKNPQSWVEETMVFKHYGQRKLTRDEARLLLRRNIPPKYMVKAISVLVDTLVTSDEILEAGWKVDLVRGARPRSDSYDERHILNIAPYGFYKEMPDAGTLEVLVLTKEDLIMDCQLKNTGEECLSQDDFYFAIGALSQARDILAEKTKFSCVVRDRDVNFKPGALY